MKKSELREMIRDVIHEELDKDDSLTEAEDITKAPFYKEYLEYNNSFDGKVGTYITINGEESYIPEFNPWTGHLVWNPDWREDWEDL